MLSLKSLQYRISEDSSSYCTQILNINECPMPLVCAEEKAAECQV